MLGFWSILFINYFTILFTVSFYMYSNFNFKINALSQLNFYFDHYLSSQWASERIRNQMFVVDRIREEFTRLGYLGWMWKLLEVEYINIRASTKVIATILLESVSEH